MAKETPSIRRQEILNILYNRGTTTAKYLAEEFQVDRKTIYKDIDYLQGHYRIERIRSRYGGYSFEGPKLNGAVVLSKEEMDLLRRIGAEVELSYQERVKFNSAMKLLEKQPTMIFRLESEDDKEYLIREGRKKKG